MLSNINYIWLQRKIYAFPSLVRIFYPRLFSGLKYKCLYLTYMFPFKENLPTLWMWTTTLQVCNIMCNFPHVNKYFFVCLFLFNSFISGLFIFYVINCFIHSRWITQRPKDETKRFFSLSINEISAIISSRMVYKAVGFWQTCKWCIALWETGL